MRDPAFDPTACAPCEDRARRTTTILGLVQEYVPHVNVGRMESIPTAVLEEVEDLLVGDDPVRCALLAARDLVTHVREHGALPDSRELNPLLAQLASARGTTVGCRSPSHWMEVAPGVVAFTGALAAEYGLANVPEAAGGWLDADPAVLLEALRARALDTFSDFLAARDADALGASAASSGLLVFMAAAATGAYGSPHRGACGSLEPVAS